MNQMDFKELEKTMKDELTSIKINKVWELVYLLEGRKPISRKWVLNKKWKENGSLDKYKW